MTLEPEEGLFKSGEYKIHYLLWDGEGPKLFFIHSMGMDAHAFDAICRTLQGEYQILCVTILGHGDSDVPEKSITLTEHSEILRRCYIKLGFVPNILIGHSVGGMIGIILAAKYPEELNGLVLVDIAPFDAKGRATRPPPPDYFVEENEAREYFRKRYIGFTSEAIENRMRYALKRDEKGRFKLKPNGSVIRPSLVIDLWPYVKEITVPTLLVLGSESTVVTPRTVSEIRNILPEFKMVTVKDATHMIPQDKPEEFVTQLRNFFKTLN